MTSTMTFANDRFSDTLLIAALGIALLFAIVISLPAIISAVTYLAATAIAVVPFTLISFGIVTGLGMITRALW